MAKEKDNYIQDRKKNKQGITKMEDNQRFSPVESAKMYVQVRLSKLCKRMDDGSNSTFKSKKPKNTKNESINTLR